MRLDDAASAERRERRAIIEPAIAHPPGSAERRAALRAIVATPVIRGGQRVLVPERTVRNWIADFDNGGEAGLQRRARKDKGTTAVILTQRWDAATKALPAELRDAIATKLQQHVRDLWGGGAVYSVVKRLASERLEDLTRRAGVNLGAAELERACELPKHFVEAGRDARRVHERRTNIKQWDNERPRVRLTSAGLAPMHIVYGDVHHFDVYVRREDGSTATPKGIAWLDAATRRLRVDLVLCEPGTAIRNADLIQSFIDMTQDPHWGVPHNLYLDNGSEYRFAAFLEDPMTLAGLGCTVFDRGGPVVRAKPYNAAAKGILEGSFRILEHKVLSPVKGYIGGDRMKSRSANLGKAPDPFDGTFADFCELFVGLLRYFNTDKQKGDLKGRSPAGAYAEAVRAGWRRTDVDPDALRTAFSLDETRIVGDGKIRVGGEVFYSDALFRHNGTRVRVQRPKFLKWDGVPVFTLKGDFIDVARLDAVFPRGSLDGAKEAERRRRLAVETVDTMEGELNPVDVAALISASGRRQPEADTPDSAGEITLAGTSATAGQRLAETAEEQFDREHKAKQRKLRERSAVHKQWAERQ